MALTVEAFVQEYSEAAKYAASQTGLSPSEILGQWALETGYGNHFAGDNNPGNVSPGGKVADYATLENGIDAYSRVINRMGLNGINDPAVFAQGLQSKGYATDPKYAEKVYNTISTIEKVQKGEAGVTGRLILNQLLPGTFQNQVQNVADGGGVFDWINDKAANWGLIMVGVVLGVAALVVQIKDQ